MKTYKHITIEEHDIVAKKPAYSVTNNNPGEELGHIEYYPDWRQYIFAPMPETVYSVSCLKDIIDFIKTEAGK